MRSCGLRAGRKTSCGGDVSALETSLGVLLPKGTPMSKFLSIRQVAEALSLSEITCYRHVEAGLIPSIKIGGRRLVPAEFLCKLEAEALDRPTLAIGQIEA